MRASCLLGAAGLLLLARPAAAVVGGEPGGPAAVGAVFEGGDFRCTATLVAEDLLVTAGHCVHHVVPSAPALTVELDGAAHPVDRVILHPDHWTAAEADLAALVLARGVDVPPLRPRLEPPPEDWDLWELSAAGRGTDDPEGEGSGGPRTLRGRPEDLTDSSLWFEADDGALCRGDSGGALLDGDELVGVLVGGDPDCEGPGEALRADVFAGFLSDPEGAGPGSRPFGEDEEEGEPTGGSGTIDLTEPVAPSDGVGCGDGGASWAWLLPVGGLPRRLRRRPTRS